MQTTWTSWWTGGQPLTLLPAQHKRHPSPCLPPCLPAWVGRPAGRPACCGLGLCAAGSQSAIPARLRPLLLPPLPRLQVQRARRRACALPGGRPRRPALHRRRRQGAAPAAAAAASTLLAWLRLRSQHMQRRGWVYLCLTPLPRLRPSTFLSAAGAPLGPLPADARRPAAAVPQPLGAHTGGGGQGAGCVWRQGRRAGGVEGVRAPPRHQRAAARPRPCPAPPRLLKPRRLLALAPAASPQASSPASRRHCLPGCPCIAFLQSTLPSR